MGLYRILKSEFNAIDYPPMPNRTANLIPVTPVQEPVAGGFFESSEMGEPTALKPKINVFLLAGSRLFREALSKILRSENDICMVGCTPCLTEAIEEVDRSGCDVVLVDPVNGEPCDFLLLESIVRVAPVAKVILINMVEDEAVFLRAICSGVVGYLLQRASAMDVVAAVRSVYEGGAVCPPSLCRSLFQRLASHGFATWRPKTRRVLTRREQELMPLIGRGLTNKEIAAQLNLSEKTVKNHIHRILRRVNATDRFAAVEIALDRKLLPCSLMHVRPS